MVASLLFPSFFFFCFASLGLLLTFHKASLDCEQKPVGFCFTICFGLHGWWQNKIALLSELSMQKQNVVSVCIRHSLLYKGGL